MLGLFVMPPPTSNGPVFPVARRTQCTTLTISIIFLVSYTAIVTLAIPVAQSIGRTPATPVRPPGVSTNNHDPTTLIVTNENTRRPSPPPLSTRDGQRDAVSSSRSSSSTNSKRQGKKLSSVDPSNLFPEKTNDYPEDEINRLLQLMPVNIKDLYNVINTPLDNRMNLTYRTSDPGGEDERQTEISVCSTRTRNIYPREANRQNSLVYIPNNQDFMQVIQAEICQHPDRECNYLVDSLSYGLTSSCVQKYAYKKLLYMDPLEKRMASDLFRYPSCCSCYVRSLPLDIRSSGNDTHTTGSKPTTLNILTGNNEQATSSVSQYLGEGPNEGSSTNQTTDRSQDFATHTQETPKKRTSKQVVRPVNQTLVLTDDKVYSP